MNRRRYLSATMRYSVRFYMLSFFCMFPALLLWAAEGSYPEKTREIPKLTVADCVLLALKNNYDVKKQFLGRIPQRYNLKVAEDKFNPTGSFTFSTAKQSIYPDIDTGRTTSSSQAGGFTATMNVITGGSFNFNWNNAASQSDVNQQYLYSPGWTLQFTQPLLKNAGIDMAMASINLARIADEQNLLGFRDFLTSTINSVIEAYRSYFSSLWSLEISKKSLETAKKNYEINKAKIAAGIAARLDIIETETNIANNELSLLTTENQLDQNRLALIRLLNIDKDTVFEPVREEAIYPSLPTLQEALSIAFQNRTDYLKSIRDVETARINFDSAKNNRLWDFSLQGRVGSIAANTDPWRASQTAWSAGKSDWSAGATLTIPFRDLTIEQAYLQSKIAYEQARIDLKRSELNIEINLKNALRDVEMSLKQMNKARQARELAEKKYEVENDKYKAGRSSNFQLVTYQNDLVNAQQTEISGLINYLNSLKNLDTALGTTLRTWNIEIAKDADEVKTTGARKGREKAGQ